MTQKFYVYIQRKPNGDPFYVGKGIGTRLLNDVERNPYYESIIKKYGRDNIQRLYRYVDSEEVAFKVEKALIWFLRDVCLYSLTNMTAGGEGCSGYRHTNDARIEMSRSRKGRPSKKKGVPLTQAHKQNVSQALKGRTPPRERVEKMARSMKGKVPWNKGIPCSPDCKKKLSLKIKGKKWGPKTLAKRRETVERNALLKASVIKEEF